MTNSKKQFRRLSRRLDRIERKCDRILSGVLVLRRDPSDIDVAIESLRNAALRMREQCEREKNGTLMMFGETVYGNGHS